MPIERIITETRAYACLDCGRCTTACPISGHDRDFSPRKLVYDAISGNGRLPVDLLWSCLTCSRCEARCQSGVRYAELIRLLRAEAYQQGSRGQCTHGGALHSLMHIMTAGSLSQNRLDWVDKSLQVTDRGDTVYFVGCAPYFDVLFADIGVRTLESTRGAVKLLNRLNIMPALLPDERCCGHDLLWSGNIESFKRLAEKNINELSRTGAKRVVTTCPECYHTLRVSYPELMGSLDFEVVHISQLMAGEAGGGLKFRRSRARVTYHDPCRLGRFSGLYDEPRALLRAVPGLELVEMARSRDSASCCGTQAWINCGATSKKIQAELLDEAKSTGATTLLTACPKCQIHLKCALADGKSGAGLIVQDMIEFLSGALARQEAGNER